MAELVMRPASMDEYPEFARTTWTAFSAHIPADVEECERKSFEPDRSLAVFDSGRIVATAGALSFELTLPGLTSTAVAGVSYVGVLPTHRRRGLLRQMMRRQLDDVYERGEALAV